MLASGMAPFEGTASVLNASDFEAGSVYLLRLEANGQSDTRSEDEVSFSIPDPKYSLIPLEAGNLREQDVLGMSMDGSGTLVAMGGDFIGEIWLLDTGANVLRKLAIPLQNTNGFQLSSDGRRLVFAGASPFILRILVLDTMELRSAPLNLFPFFGVNRTGDRIAVWAVDPASNTEQFYVYDDATEKVRRLTNDPQAVDPNVRCPRLVVGAGVDPLLRQISARNKLVSAASRRCWL